MRGEVSCLPFNVMLRAFVYSPTISGPLNHPNVEDGVNTDAMTQRRHICYFNNLI